MADSHRGLPGLEDYSPVDRLGEGGMGAVFRVRHRRSGELRVAKVLHRALAGDPRFVARFEREALLLGRLDHAHVARLHEWLRSDDGDAVLVMEHVEGLDLHRLLRRVGPLPPALVIALGRQVASALDALHGLGWVHRDLSPDNLLVRRTEGVEPGATGLEAVLIDLGIAKATVGEGTTLGAPGEGTVTALDRASLTTEGGFLGKLRYSSPEQLSGTSELDGRSDLYALGVVLYELLTGRLPIEGSGPDAWVAGHLLRPPLPFQEDEAHVPGALRRLVMGLLAKDPARRPASARAVEEALAGLEAEHPATAELLAPWVREVEAGGRSPAPVEGPTVIQGADGEYGGRQRGRRRGLGGLLVAGSGVLVLVLALAAGFSGIFEPSTGSPTVIEPGAEVPSPAPSSSISPIPSTPPTDADSSTGAEIPAVEEGVAESADESAVESAVEPADRAPVVVGTGRLELDATPWAELVAIRDAEGRPVERMAVEEGALAGDAVFTPLALELLPGIYELVLRHPGDPAEVGTEQRQRIEVEIREARTVYRHVDMQEVNIDDFFRGLGWP